MLTISKPLSAGQAQTYHQKEFTSKEQNYWSQRGVIVGEWQAQLTAQLCLAGTVSAEDFAKLSQGQHPHNGEQLVRQRASYEYQDADGKTIKTMEHRAGWDATFSAPKSVSLTALVGGDERVREAHRESVGVALDELEKYVQARLGGNLPAETTGKWAAAKFEHDSARPVDGYAAPQLHTHVVFFNLTDTANGEVRPVQPRELYKSQQYATAVYRSELAARLTALGYEIQRGDSGQPEVRGYTQACLDASSPRRQQIEAHLAQEHRTGAAAAQIAAHKTREVKLDLTHEEVHRQHRALAEAFGDQPALVVRVAQERAHHLEAHTPQITPRAAVTFAKERNLEREAVVDERVLLRDALRRSMGDLAFGDIKTEFDQRVQTGEFIAASQRPGAPGRALPTQG